MTAGAALAAGAVGGVAGAYFLDPERIGKHRRRVVGRWVPAIRRVEALVGRRASREEAEERVDTTAVQMAAGNGAGAPVPAKDTVDAAA